MENKKIKLFGDMKIAERLRLWLCSSNVYHNGVFYPIIKDNSFGLLDFFQLFATWIYILIGSSMLNGFRYLIEL